MTTSYTRSAQRASRREATRTKKYVAIVSCVVVFIGATIAVIVTRPWAHGPAHPIHPTQSVHYLGVYEPDAPQTYAGVNQFARAIGRQPNLVSYYNSWLEPFQVGFATSAAKHGAVTVVQIDPENVSLASIADGQYDAYLRSYATAVKAFGAQVVLSFGHEMNGNWYSWGNQHTSPKVFVAAWRHVVTVFRATGVENVTWLWTVNVIDKSIPIPDPALWWPGSSYVNWVGIDGYYYMSSQSFSQVFGPTIVAVRNLTGDPILIAETGVSPDAGQPAKINDLFAGIRSYGLLGLLWFDENTQGRTWHINSPASFAAFRQDAATFMRPAATPGPTPKHQSSGSSSSLWSRLGGSRAAIFGVSAGRRTPRVVGRPGYCGPDVSDAPDAARTVSRSRLRLGGNVRVVEEAGGIHKQAVKLYSATGGSAPPRTAAPCCRHRSATPSIWRPPRPGRARPSALRRRPGWTSRARTQR